MAAASSAELSGEGGQRIATDGISSQAYTGRSPCQKLLTHSARREQEKRQFRPFSSLALFLRGLSQATFLTGRRPMLHGLKLSSLIARATTVTGVALASLTLLG